MALAIIKAGQQAPTRNRHPVDELADIRAEQKRLKDREDELKAQILAAPNDLTGFDYLAVVTTVESERVDTKAVRELLGEKINSVIKKSSSRVVKTFKRDAPEPEAA